MKREVAALAAITLAVSLLAACGVETPEVSLPPEDMAPVSAPAADISETERVLGECFKLLGTTDGESADALGGGAANIAADGETLIGRVYTVTLFGGEVELSSSYDASGRVGAVSAYLPQPDGSEYRAELTDIYGEPALVSGGAGEGGSTWVGWDIDSARLRLIQGYGLCSLEISAIPVQ